MKTYRGRIENLITRVQGLLGDNVEKFQKTMVVVHNLQPVVKLISVARRNEKGLFEFNKGAVVSQGELRGLKFMMLHKADAGHNTKKEFSHNTFGLRHVGYAEHVIKNADVLRYDFNNPTIDVMSTSGQAMVKDNGQMKLEMLDIVDMLTFDNTPRNLIMHNVAIKINGAMVKDTYNRHIGRVKKSKSFINYKNPAITQVLTNPKLVG